MPSDETDESGSKAHALGRIPKVKRPKTVVSRPSAAQLKMVADRFEKDGDLGQAEAFDMVAADTARDETLAREHGADLSEEGFNEVLRKTISPKAR